MPQPSRGSLLEPGQFVRHPGQPDWGEGQVQSVVGERVTVIRIDAVTYACERRQPVQSTAIEEVKTERGGDQRCNRALARSGRAVDRNNRSLVERTGRFHRRRPDRRNTVRG